jgi:hypothetical protein
LIASGYGADGRDQGKQISGEKKISPLEQSFENHFLLIAACLKCRQLSLARRLVHAGDDNVLSPLAQQLMKAEQTANATTESASFAHGAVPQLAIPALRLIRNS